MIGQPPIALLEGWLAGRPSQLHREHPRSLYVAPEAGVEAASRAVIPNCLLRPSRREEVRRGLRNRVMRPTLHPSFASFEVKQ